MQAARLPSLALYRMCRAKLTMSVDKKSKAEVVLGEAASVGGPLSLQVLPQTLEEWVANLSLGRLSAVLNLGH